MRWRVICLGPVLLTACGEPGIGPARMPRTLRARAPATPVSAPQRPTVPKLPPAARTAPPDAAADSRLCAEASRIAPLGMDLEKYDADEYIATCEGHLGSDRGPAWREFYGCIVEVGDSSWLRACIKKSPGTR